MTSSSRSWPPTSRATSRLTQDIHKHIIQRLTIISFYSINSPCAIFISKLSDFQIYNILEYRGTMSRSGVQRVELQAHNIERRTPFLQSPLGEIHTTRAGPAHSAWPHTDDVLLRLLLHCVWRPQAESPAPGGVCHPHTPSRAGGEECLAELFYIGILST